MFLTTINCYYIAIDFSGQTLMDAFNKLWFFLRVLLNTQLAYAVIRGWCKQYCDEHWHDEYIDWTVLSTDDFM